MTDGIEFTQLVDAANEAPVILEKDGVRYRLTREEDGPWVSYDSQAVLAAIRAARGMLSPEERETLKAYVYCARDEGSRPVDQP